MFISLMKSVAAEELRNLRHHWMRALQLEGLQMTSFHPDLQHDGIHIMQFNPKAITNEKRRSVYGSASPAQTPRCQLLLRPRSNGQSTTRANHGMRPSWRGFT